MNERGGESLLEQLREAEPWRKLASAVEPARQPATVERIRERMREAESKEEEAEGTVKIVGI